MLFINIVTAAASSNCLSIPFMVILRTSALSFGIPRVRLQPNQIRAVKYLILQDGNQQAFCMLSKSQISLLTSLQHKKFRREHGFFLVEGYKSVVEFTGSGYQVDTIYHTDAIAPKMLNLSRKINFQEISMKDIEKISTLKTPQEVIGLVKIPLWPTLNYDSLKQKFRWCWITSRIPAIWVPLSALPTGLALPILYAAKIRLMYTTPK
jgi:hypothetical protein